MFRSKALRPIAGVVLITFTALTLQPLTAAAQLPPAPKPAPARSDSGEERFSRTLNEIHEILKEVVPQSAMPHRSRSSAPEAAGKPGEKVLQAVGPKMRMESERAKPAPGIDLAAKLKSLRGKYKELKSLEGEVTKGFKETEKHIRDKNLPAEILARHEQAVAEYERRKGEFAALMDAVEGADDGKGNLAGALTSLGEFMAKYPNQKTHTPTDPNNLPWGSPKPVTRAPYTSPSQFKTSRLFGEPVKVAQAGSLSGIGLPNTTLPVTPTPADIAPTEDVQITQAIRDLATSLGNKPVPIYNWVRNNIAFIPSYGSIQGSDMTLQTKRGNSFDTASLLIALLRAANIPARYVYGTIEVPADKAMNWVGGVTVPQAAQNLMGQGGIPNIGVAQGGQVKAIRLEHVWVEAFVDYTPSRGAVNRNPNTWVPMDASFKQYQFTQGMDLNTSTSFDPQPFVTQFLQGATVNEQEGFVQNINQDAIRATLTGYRNQLAASINNQKANATLDDALGAQTIVQENRPILLGTLPYARVATGSKFQSIPDNLRWKFRYNIYASDFDRAMDSPSAGLSRSTATLAGRKITLSFAPASQADLNVINSFLPRPHPDGSPMQLSEFPQTLPSYLIRLVPELRLGGEIVGTGSASTMGSQLIQNAAYYNPSAGQWEQGEDNQIALGEYTATALDLQGISPREAGDLASRLSAVATRVRQFMLDPSSASSGFAFTKENLVGDLLYSAILIYFVTIDGEADTSARMMGVVTNRMPSYGNFGIAFKVGFFFGLPKTTSFTSMQIDVDRILGAEVSKDGSQAQLLAFRRVVGPVFSVNEHLVPERLFVSDVDPVQRQAVSAVKALSVAASSGQKIYSLQSRNESSHAAILQQLNIDADVKQEIVNALAIGREVTVHDSPITLNGYTAVGYIILDPVTGAGAYKISGGANGGAQSNPLPAIAEALLGLVVSDANAQGLDPITGLTALEALIKAFETAFGIGRAFEECSNPSQVIGLLLLDLIMSIIIGKALAGLVFAAAAGAFLALEILLALFIGIIFFILVEELIFITNCKKA